MPQEPLLINTNILRPPVSPVGLEYVGEALVDAGIPVQVLDLAFEADWKSALRQQLSREEPLFIGLSVRNTDDCSFASRRSFVPWISEVVAEIRQLSQARIVLGGVGFSILPEAVLELTGADAGLAGDGEEMIVALTGRMVKNEPIFDLPNLVYRNQGKVVSNKRQEVDLLHWPGPRRRLIDNKKYEELGALVGIETKRGCAQKCIFCADPVAKGRRLRLRPPSTVVKEFQDLLGQGVSWFHLSDSEFNQPIEHAKETCRAIIEAGLGDKLKWYCYCSPHPFDRDLALLMVRAGCRGINFGVDSLDNDQLARLGRSYSLSEIENLARTMKAEKINYIFDLLIGGPGETAETVRSTIRKVKELDIPLVGVATGVRIYPNTLLGEAIAGGFGKEGMHPAGPLAWKEPSFYISPDLNQEIDAFLRELVGDDPRFLSLVSPSESGSYNYAGDEALCELIRKGARGAYWEIIRQNRPQAAPATGRKEQEK
jgi:radical SAM superfamily enzyme YgiQ (UPF0313 family)